MVLNSQLANMLSIIKNGQRSFLPTVSVPTSNLCSPILNILYKEGFISGFTLKLDKKFPYYNIQLKYLQGVPVIQDLICVSKPGKKTYLTVKEIKNTKYQADTLIITTTLGILTDKEALIKNVGGNLLCRIR